MIETIYKEVDILPKERRRICHISAFISWHLGNIFSHKTWLNDSLLSFSFL